MDKKYAIVVLAILVLLNIGLIFVGLHGVGNAAEIPGEAEKDINDITATQKDISGDFATEEDYQEYLEKVQELEAVDADEYFASNAESIEKIYDVDADKVFEEKEVYDFLKERGFEEYPIVADYDMEGNYLGRIEISASSSERHPIYQTSYISENDDVWTVLVVGKCIMANPTTYNTTGEIAVQKMLSEVDEVTSYDSNSNKFYETVPSDKVLMIKRVERIDAKTLDAISLTESDGL